MNRIFWDTMLFIYLFEDHPLFGDRVAHLARQIEVRGDRLCTSALVVGEVLAGAEKSGDLALKSAYMAYFSSGEIEVIPFTLAAAEIFARVRTGQRIAAPDAIQLACAATAGVDLFVTHDKRLGGKQPPGVRFVVDLAQDVL